MVHSGRDPPTNAGDHETQGSILDGRSGGGNSILLQSILPGESHGHGILAGWKSMGLQESDMTEAAWHAHTQTIPEHKYS